MQPEVVIFVIAVVLLASTAQTVAGFGFALISVPFLITVLDVRDTVVAVSILGWLNSTIVARSVWRHVPVRAVVTMLLASLAGMPVGLAVLVFAPPDALRLAVAVSSIAMALAIASGLRWRGSDRSGEIVAGAISGVLNTSTGMNGPPVVLYLQERGYPPDAFRGALSAFFFVSGIVSLGAFAVSGVMTWESLALGGAGIPAVLLGHAAGHRLLGRLSEAAFRRMVLGLLIVTALSSMGLAIARLAG